MLALVARGVRRTLLLALAGAALLPALGAGAATSALAAGAAGGNSFNELTGSPPETQTTPAKTTSKTTRGTSESNSSNSQTTVLVALGAALVLLVGIALVIMRDARRVAPAGEGDLLEARSGSDPAAQLRKRRAKAKAARQQRKRNR
jgi:hypothetical protein